jgi:hypothetical protein
MLHNGLLNLQFAQHVLGTIMPIIRSSRLYRFSQRVTHDCKEGTLESEANSVVVSAVLSCVEYVDQAVWYIWYVVGVVWWLIEGLQGCCHKLMSKTCEYWGRQRQ